MPWPEKWNASQSPQNVVLVDPATGVAYAAGGGGATVIAGGNGTTASSSANPVPVADAQGTVTQTTITLVAATAQTALAASANRRGARILNYTASPVYVTVTGVTGTPASGAPSDFIPAAAGGVPGQWEPPFAPVAGVRVVGASAGGLSVMDW